MPENYFCHFTEHFERDKLYHLSVQRYFVQSNDEIIDIRMRQTTDEGESQEVLISNAMINFEQSRSYYNDYSQIDFRFRPQHTDGMQIDIFVKSLKET